MENISDFSSSDSGLQAIRRDINTMTVENPDWEEIQDGYQLRFIGKDYAKLQASLPTETLLVPDVEHNAYSHNQKSENIFITGDNLDTLKHLEKAYTKAIKMIYIDPPYNTGSDGFVYKDNFQFTDDELQQKLSLTEKEVKKIRLLNGKCSHSAWLTFMLPRLILARRLLKDDGVIFISIDDNEQANLKLLCDEIFGEGNFVGDFIRKTKSKTNDAKTGVNYQHEFLLCYAKNSENVNLLGGEKDLSKYTNPDNDPNGLWISSDPSAKRITKNGNFPIINPYTGKTDYPPKGRDWCFSQNTLQDHINAGRICFKKEHKDDERGFIYKRYLKDLATTQKMFDSLAFVDNAYMNQAATTELKELGLVESFPYPKGVEFIKKIIEHIAQKSTQENDIILDFFAGSGTTAHAVMQYNAENRGGGGSPYTTLSSSLTSL
ncbi:MAG: site-specific DNA-methyltransferase [Acetobacter sp.]|nr:site-specific DNA-methyltransferase [Acetobacter sp.]